MVAPIAVALDAPELHTAARWSAAVAPHVTTVKIGLGLYLRYGPEAVAAVRGANKVEVFLDLKLHVIPAQVAAAAHSVAGLRPSILTVHASGGPEMVEAAARAAPEVTVAAVTVLTSLDEPALNRIGIEGTAPQAVLRLARLAVEAGARALVCSPQEVAMLRSELGPEVALITPGVRPEGVASQDQRRVATPRQALREGADLLVVGRPITGAESPAAAAAEIAASVEGRTEV